ncbi:MAG: hypothetical protein II312_13825 [Lachnospiraceae bacterium]|nr:hypothetical protein [Lachnospiraceae bacterium]
MSRYFNPNNESFSSDKNSMIYKDKTGLLEYLNGVIIMRLDLERIILCT